jgi:hypothetical protein
MKPFIRGCVLAFVLTSAASAAPQWVQTWGAAPLPPTPALGPFPATPSFNNQTVRQTVRVSAGGQRIRIRLSNEYGAKPLVVGAMRVALADAKGNIQPGTTHPVLFSGNPSVTVGAWSTWESVVTASWVMAPDKARWPGSIATSSPHLARKSSSCSKE